MIKPLLLVFFALNNIFTSVRAEYKLGDQISSPKNLIRSKVSEDDIKHPLNVYGKLQDFSTVEIFASGAPGSGVIIAKKNNNYFVLTAKHVIGKILKGDEIEIKSIDGEFHNAKVIKEANKVDAVLLKFNSKKHYYPAFIDPNTFPKAQMYTIIMGYALPFKEAKKGSLRKSEGSVISIINNNTDGYDVLYDNATNVGMSGGPVFTWIRNGRTEERKKLLLTWQLNTKTGKYPKDFYCNSLEIPPLIALHGRAESYRYGGKSGVNMGIPIQKLLNIFGETLKENGIEVLKKEKDTTLFKDACLLKLKENGFPQP